jgi:hypothetical protein
VDPVWTLFSRRALSGLAYWLSALGYDLRDRSVANRVYLFYFCAFWAVWTVAVLSLLGSGVATVLFEIQSYLPPSQVVIVLTKYAFAIWGLANLWQVSRRSPFMFTEEDAYLLCQTPVDRRKVGMLWFFQAAIRTLLPFAAGAVVLSFALTEWRLEGVATLSLVFESLKESCRALMLVIPLQIGTQAALWGFGALRLQRKRELPWVRHLSTAAVLLFLAGFFIPGLHPLLLSPLAPPISGSFSQGVPFSNELAPLGLSLLYLVAGVSLLSTQTKNISLQRAAQETSHISAVRLARRYGQHGLAESLLLRRRLGTTRSPSRFLGGSGKNVLFRKDLVQSLRSIRLGDIINLIWIIGLSISMFGAPDWRLQVVVAGVWTVSIGGYTTRRLRGDLAHWWLFGSLPLTAERILAGEMLFSCGIAVAASWLALAFSGGHALFVLSAIALSPALAASAALAGMRDILQHSDTRAFMSPGITVENVPQQGVGGVFQGLVTVLIPFGVLVGASPLSGHPLWSLGSIPLAVVGVWLNWRSALTAFLRIR